MCLVDNTFTLELDVYKCETKDYSTHNLSSMANEFVICMFERL